MFESEEEGLPLENGTVSLSDLDKIFIEDDRLNEMRSFVEPYIKKLDWRKGHVHRRLYNIKNFAAGILAKLEKTRTKPGSEAACKIAELLYTMGYGTKRITYILFTYGYRTITEEQVRKHVAGEKYKLNKLRDEMVAVIDDTKKKIFQEMGEEVLASEKRTLELMLRHIAALQDQLDTLDPVTEAGKCTRVINTLRTLQADVNKMHGIEEYRKASIDASKTIMVEREKAKIQSEYRGGAKPANPALGNGDSSILIIE